MDRLTLLVVLTSLIALQAGNACSCKGSTSACQEVAAGSMVFSGTVESISPRFLEHWNLKRRQMLSEIVGSFQFQNESSPAALIALRNKIREAFPDLPRPMAKRLDEAQTHDALLRIFDSALNSRQVIRFRVHKLFARGHDNDDDDDDADADEDDVPKFIEIATPSSDCGYHFQQGETYLVYGIRDEDSDLVETDVCTATKRLSDAGQDLAYLHFYLNNPKAAGHLDGTARYSPLFGQLANDRRTPDPPAGGLVVGLGSDQGSRYAISDAAGKFFFDGLGPGDYSLNVWAKGYPDTVKLLDGPYQFQIGRNNRCIERTLKIPPP